MIDAISVFPPGWRATDEFAAVVSGGKLEFYAAGTSNPLEVFSNQELTTSLGTIVDLSAGGYPITPGQHRTLIYLGPASYLVVLKDAAGATVWSHDDVRGALDTSPFGATRATPKYAIAASGVDITITADQVGTLFRVDSSGGNRNATLPNAVTAEVGVPIGIQHAGSGNTVTIATVASQVVFIQGDETESVVLTGNGETIFIASNGADWVMVGKIPPAAADQVISDVTVSVAVASIDIEIPAGVTGIRLIGTGLSCSTTANLYFAISDDAGLSFEIINARYFRDNANTVTGADSTINAPVVVFATTAAASDVNFMAEILLADLAAAKKSIAAHGSSANDNQAVALEGESVSCDAINLVRVAFSTGNVDAGRVICQRI